MEFDAVFALEQAEIRARRERRRSSGVVGTADQAGDDAQADSLVEHLLNGLPDTPADEETPRDLVGIAISGGGIRSATFALGALQGLARTPLLERADYLSTVSGGGYIGSSLSSQYGTGAKQFPFAPGDGAQEATAVRHLRRYSNYLAPRGPIDWLRMPGVMLRGVLANLLALLPFLLALVIALTELAWERVSNAMVSGTAVVVDAYPDGDETTFAARGKGLVTTNFDDIIASIPRNRGSVLLYGLPSDVVVATSPSIKPDAFVVNAHTARISLSDADNTALSLAPEAGLQIRACGVEAESCTGAWRSAARAYAELTAVPGDRARQRCEHQDRRGLPALTGGLERFGEAVCVADLLDEVLAAASVRDGVSAMGFVELRVEPGRTFAVFNDDVAEPADSNKNVVLRLHHSPGARPLEGGVWYVPRNEIDAIALTEPASGENTYTFSVKQRRCGDYPEAGTSVACQWVPHWQPPSIWNDAFEVSRWLLGLFGAVLIIYTIAARLSTRIAKAVAATYPYVLVLLAVAAIIELQPVAAFYFSATWSWMVAAGATWDLTSITYALQAVGLTTVAALGNRARQIGSVPDRYRIYAIGLLGPLAIWFSFLLLSHFALCRPPGALVEFMQWLYAFVFGDAQQILSLTTAESMCFAPAERYYGQQAVVLFFAGLTLLGYVLTVLFVDVNKTSLHSFYRDRLSDAYLFQSTFDETNGEHAGNDAQKLSSLADTGPYHLINTTLNHSPDSTRAYARRTVEHFLFSKLAIGSDLTGFSHTTDLEHADPHVNLGTAMAISGAAASTRMGSMTVAILPVLLGLLNVRLGYWLINPRRVTGPAAAGWYRMMTKLRQPGPAYLLREMIGSLSPKDDYLNLSDGGHLENLGLFPLLKRRCRLIVAIDAEHDAADGQHQFEGLATAARLAQIELGFTIRIDLDGVGQAGKRPFAVGTIDYGRGRAPGALVVLKSSVTGGENVYIQEYRAKQPAFPHETTGDQFFDEAQFEAYRALGLHVATAFASASRPDGQ